MTCAPGYPLACIHQYLGSLVVVRWSFSFAVCPTRTGILPDAMYSNILFSHLQVICTSFLSPVPLCPTSIVSSSQVKEPSISVRRGFNITLTMVMLVSCAHILLEREPSFLRSCG